MSRFSSLERSFKEEWQFPHTRKFLIIVSGVPGGVVINPYVRASRSLCVHNSNSFSSLEMFFVTHDMSGLNPAFFILASWFGISFQIFHISGCVVSCATKLCTLPPDSI